MNEDAAEYHEGAEELGPEEDGETSPEVYEVTAGSVIVVRTRGEEEQRRIGTKVAQDDEKRKGRRRERRTKRRDPYEAADSEQQNVQVARLIHLGRRQTPLFTLREEEGDTSAWREEKGVGSQPHSAAKLRNNAGRTRLEVSAKRSERDDDQDSMLLPLWPVEGVARVVARLRYEDGASVLGGLQACCCCILDLEDEVAAVLLELSVGANDVSAVLVVCERGSLLDVEPGRHRAVCVVQVVVGGERGSLRDVGSRLSRRSPLRTKS